MNENRITIALAGNPNSGKTSIFNSITGTRQKVGNWSGVTVEKKEGFTSVNGKDIKIVDLPGIYSLTPFSIEEVIARNYLIEDNPDVVIDIIDSTNLERGLYLATQIMELNYRVVLALNMDDIARSSGIRIDGEKLSELLDIPVVFTVANRGEKTLELVEEAVSIAGRQKGYSEKRKIRYSAELEKSIGIVSNYIKSIMPSGGLLSTRWVSIKLLENDGPVIEKISRLTSGGDDISSLVSNERERLKRLYGDDPEMIMADERYGFIEGITREVLQTPSISRVDFSRKIDSVLTNRFFGLPLFAFFIWLMFQSTFSMGQYPMDWIEKFISLLSTTLSGLMTDGLLKSLLIDGILTGVGGVVIFLPNILILFFCIAIFEDTGYMARAAFLMDKIMHIIGLHGKSFIPMLMGFGCNVPAIMAARTLENDRDRILTILITPFMSCSARLPVFIILSGAFFPEHAGNVIFSLYFLGILVAVMSGKILSSTILKGDDAPFVMELPPYRVPMLKSLVIHMWDRSRMFLKKMGGVILAGSVIVWALSYFPVNVEYSKDYDNQILVLLKSIEKEADKADRVEILKSEIDFLTAEKKKEHVEKSYMGKIGEFVSPVFEPIGIDWRGSIALITGFVAKEIVVSTMGVLYGAESLDEGESGLESALIKSGMTPQGAFSMMVFVLLYLPCVATIAAVYRETGSMKWTGFSILYTTSVAWGFSFIIFRLGSLF